QNEEQVQGEADTTPATKGLVVTPAPTTSTPVEETPATVVPVTEAPVATPAPTTSTPTTESPKGKDCESNF
ncbi:hypothetical protein G195_011731, partial [Phytophthora kernoviae 00238/432]